VSGITRPDAVVVSASDALTTIRSSSGLMATAIVLLLLSSFILGKSGQTSSLARAAELAD
jgi:hypothetical protein